MKTLTLDSNFTLQTTHMNVYLQDTGTGSGQYLHTSFTYQI